MGFLLAHDNAVGQGEAAVHKIMMADLEDPDGIVMSWSRADERRERLIEAARALFAEHGFHGAGIAQIASRSGVKVGQIYRDFANKEEIVGAIVEADLKAFLDEEALAAAIEQGDMAAVRGWILDLVLRKAHPAEAPLLPEILAESARNERIAAIVSETDRRVRASLSAALAAFPGSSVCPERLSTSADLIMTVMTGLCSRQLARLQVATPPLTARVQQIIDGEIDVITRACAGTRIDRP
jgi:AcrR family transcriptional regulator